jgi:hypothetical protein
MHGYAIDRSRQKRCHTERSRQIAHFCALFGKQGYCASEAPTVIAAQRQLGIDPPWSPAAFQGNLV